MAKKLIIDLESLNEDPKKVFEDSMHEDLVALIGEDEYDDMEVKGMEIVLEQIAEEISTELAENDRVADVAENLSDVADVLENSGNDQITPTEAQLIATNANMAVAGTDGDAADIAPALEAFKDKSLAIEQLRMKQQVAIEGIMDSIKNVTQKIGSYIKGLFSFAAKMENRIKGLKSKVAELDSKPNKEITTKLNKFYALKKNESEFVGSAEEYKSLLTKTVTFFDSFSTLVIKSVTNFTNSYKNYYKTLPGTDATFKEASRLYTLYMDTSKEIVNLPGIKEIPTRDSKVKKYRSEYLLGGAAVDAQIYKDVPVSEENIPEMKNAVANTGVKFKQWNAKDISKSKDKTIDFKVNKNYLIDIIAQAEKALGIFKRFLDGAYKWNSNWSMLDGAKVASASKFLSLHTQIVNKGTNHTNFYISYARAYAKVLTDYPLDVVQKLANAKEWDKAAAE